MASLLGKSFGSKTLRSIVQHGCNKNQRFMLNIGDSSNRFPLFRHTPVASFATTTTTATTDDLQAKQKMTTIRLYRILQRQLRGLAMVTPEDEEEEEVLKNQTTNTRSLLLQPMLIPSDWGRHSISTPSNPSAITIQDLYQLFYLYIDDDDDDPSPFSVSSTTMTIDDWWYHVAGTIENPLLEPTGVPPITTCWTTIEQLQQATKHAFSCDYKKIDKNDLSSLHKWAIRAIQWLQQQEFLWKHSSVCDTQGIRVVASSCCIGTTPSAPGALDDTRYRYCYRIRIENRSDRHVQLLGRFWSIQELVENNAEDGTNYQPEPMVVQAPITGAVGQLPVLRPGQCFEYTSGSDLASPKGIMKGHFYMAWVPPESPSAKAGDNIEILNNLQEEDKLQAIVAPFPLEAK